MCVSLGTAQTPTIEDFMLTTGVTHAHLDGEIENLDTYTLAGYIEHPQQLLDNLGLLPADQADIRNIVARDGTQAGVAEALKAWRKRNPMTATFRQLVNIVLSTRRGDVARAICRYAAEKQTNSRTVQQLSQPGLFDFLMIELWYVSPCIESALIWHS